MHTRIYAHTPRIDDTAYTHTPSPIARASPPTPTPLTLTLDPSAHPSARCAPTYPRAHPRRILVARTCIVPTVCVRPRVTTVDAPRVRIAIGPIRGPTIGIRVHQSDRPRSPLRARAIGRRRRSVGAKRRDARGRHPRAIRVPRAGLMCAMFFVSVRSHVGMTGHESLSARTCTRHRCARHSRVDCVATRGVIDTFYASVRVFARSGARTTRERCSERSVSCVRACVCVWVGVCDGSYPLVPTSERRRRRVTCGVWRWRARVAMEDGAWRWRTCGARMCARARGVCGRRARGDARW